MLEQKILLVEDDASLSQAISETLTLAGYHAMVACHANQAKEILNSLSIHMVISDINLGDGLNGIDLLKEIKADYPEMPVLMITAYSNIEDAVMTIKLGAMNYLAKPFVPESLIAMVSRYALSAEKIHDEMIACDPKTKKIQSMAKRVAKSPISVLLEGESGTGKEVFAQYIHQCSDCTGDYVAVNCAAIPDNMLEAMLFGYEKGAFTGAYQSQPGKFELAQNGTILLDEISEMPFALQAKLLRVLQEKEVERLGGKKTVPLQVRVIAATNRNLKAYVLEKKFREDLYFRLSVFPIKIPPLRERKEDILPLAEHFIREFSGQMNEEVPLITHEAKKMLLTRNWPGNIRELQNVLQRAFVLKKGNVLTEKDFIFEVDEKNKCVPSIKSSLRDNEYQTIIQVLRDHDGCRKTTADSLGISARTLRHKICKMREVGYVVPKTNRFVKGGD